ncbi:hypothetical protein M5585_19210 [Serratia ureilytica]
MTIRRINGDDKAQWLALWQGYLDFYRADVAPQVTDRTFERLGQDEQVYGLVAQDADGQLLGLMNLVFHPSTGARSAIVISRISMCRRRLRPQGVGKAVRTGVPLGRDARQRSGLLDDPGTTRRRARCTTKSAEEARLSFIPVNRRRRVWQ